jgi:hypothetical protein
MHDMKLKRLTVRDEGIDRFCTLVMKCLHRERECIASVDHVIDENNNLTSSRQSQNEIDYLQHEIFKLTLSFTSPTRISICSGADRDLPFRFL